MGSPGSFGSYPAKEQPEVTYIELLKEVKKL